MTQKQLWCSSLPHLQNQLGSVISYEGASAGEQADLPKLRHGIKSLSCLRCLEWNLAFSLNVNISATGATVCQSIITWLGPTIITVTLLRRVQNVLLCRILGFYMNNIWFHDKTWCHISNDESDLNYRLVSKCLQCIKCKFMFSLYLFVCIFLNISGEKTATSSK